MKAASARGDEAEQQGLWFVAPVQAQIASHALHGAEGWGGGEDQGMLVAHARSSRRAEYKCHVGLKSHILAG
eukprot:CAMPEP_0195107038 /NCGR_PEP_ID=MMETSP0448-20130528/81848_1 /TAXON_ID=66468 /ORGANISM="Heterocapsa triquestra, Strain CCMP 448" /LENGTH=71 /DNA_ID=CAMNT_0040143423 /DNA_START=20 /DNA_END=237 /DNA_ORIENTATION=+